VTLLLRMHSVNPKRVYAIAPTAMLLAIWPALFFGQTHLSTTAQGAHGVSSRHLHAEADATQPALAAISVDSLGRSEFGPSPLRVSAPSSSYRVVTSGSWTRYYIGTSTQPVWEIQIGEHTLVFRTTYQADAKMDDLELSFDSTHSHVTLLGRTAPDGTVRMPALLHIPGMGSLEVDAPGSSGVALHYHSGRATLQYVKVAFPAADSAHRSIVYQLRVTAISPALSPDSDSLPLSGFRRDFIDGLQLNAELHVLANNSASDACPFTLYEAADIALASPPLAKGLTALDLVRETLDRYAQGFVGYGMPDYYMFDHPGEKPAIPYTFLDVYPSLLISAYDYVIGSHDKVWLHANYPVLQRWTEQMVAQASPETGLLSYPVSGNSGSWTPKITVRPANWWDTIGFGHEDAWSNALAYRALRSMAALAKLEGDVPGATKYKQSAELLKAHYASAFFNPATGLLAGWRSADGKLHDYAFLFVNGAAIRYGLLEPKQVESIVQHMLTAIQTAGYDRFDLGLPGNLKPVRREDYVDLDPRFGGPKLEDGSDGFQIYENGGATAAFAYFTIAALYQTHHRAEGDRILIPMLNSFAKQGFSGRGANGLSNDWKDWHGGAHGYEGFLADNYYALLGVMEREHRGPLLP
jgi:hypothetical protein